MAVFSGRESQELSAMRQQLGAAQSHIAQLQGWINQLRGAETAQLETELRQLQSAVTAKRAEAQASQRDASRAEAELKALGQQVVEVRDRAALQEIGLYEYAHPLEDALAYREALAELSAQIKAAAKTDAVTCEVTWAVNGSVKEGQKMGRDIAKLMLRAYNTEADNAVRSVKPHTRDAAKKRLDRSRDTVAKLGAALRIAISTQYHRLRLKEIDLTADHLMKVEVEKENQRAERERLREEAKLMKEIEKERARLAKERAHYETAAAKLAATSDADPHSVQAIQAKLAELQAAEASVDARAANVRCGYVYVISNIGAFGPDVVKIGLTRRLEPLDRVRELGDASVPFRFDVHGLFFSNDAVSLETELHHQFADRRVNLVNQRREFFYVTPEEVRSALVELGSEHVLQYAEEPEALEWRASDPGRRNRHANGHAATGAASVVNSSVPVHAAAEPSMDGDLSDDGAA